MRYALALCMCLVASDANGQKVEAFAIGGVQHLTITRDAAQPRVVKWGARLGAGAHIRWALVRSQNDDERRRNCRSLTSFDGLLQRSGIGRDVLVREIELATHVWSELADLTFQQVLDEREADVLIGAMAEPLAYAFADVRVRSSPDDDIDQIEQSVICLNPVKEWRVRGGSDSAFTLARALTHEFGHAIGYDHPIRKHPEGIMSNEHISDVVHANEFERAAAVRVYGPPRKKTPSG